MGSPACPYLIKRQNLICVCEGESGDGVNAMQDGMVVVPPGLAFRISCPYRYVCM